MKCKKHPGSEIPCPTCMLDEYVYFQKINDDNIKLGKEPPNNLNDLEGELRRLKLIP